LRCAANKPTQKTDQKLKRSVWHRLLFFGGLLVFLLIGAGNNILQAS
jgi:hypothetical protein